jgi:hypothetical protein
MLRVPDTFTYLDPLSLPHISMSAIDAADGVFVEHSGSERVFQRKVPEFHDDPDGVVLFGDIGACTVTYPPAFLISKRDVLQVGDRTFLDQEGQFFTDEAFLTADAQGRFLARLGHADAFLNEDTGLVPHGDRFRFERRARRVIHLEGRTLALCSTEPRNYGSFLVRVLPKLAGSNCLPPGIRVLVPAHHTSTRELLLMCGVEDHQIIVQSKDTIYQLDHALIPCLRNNQALLDDETLALFADLRARHGLPLQGRRIFVSRSGFGASRRRSAGWTYRRRAAGRDRIMLNEPRLVELITAAGFEIVLPHTLSIREQIATFSSAELVVGAAGSHMFNAVFCHPGARLIDIEAEPHWIHAHMCLFGSLGLRFGIFEAKAADRDWNRLHKPFTVNVQALVERIGAMMD